MNSSYLSKPIISSTMECDVTLVNSDEQSKKQQQQSSSSQTRQQQINSVAVTISGSLSSENHKKHHHDIITISKIKTTNNHQIIPHTTTSAATLSSQGTTFHHSRIHNTIQQSKPQIQIIHQTNNQPTSSSAQQQNRHLQQNHHYAQQKIQLTTTPIFIPKQLPPKLSKIKTQILPLTTNQHHHQQLQQNKLITASATVTPPHPTQIQQQQQKLGGISEIEQQQQHEEETDPLAIDNTQIIPESSQIALGLQKQNPSQYLSTAAVATSSSSSKIVKHTHSLRRPRIIFKPIPEKQSSSSSQSTQQNKLEKNDKINSNIGVQLRHSTLSATASSSATTASTMREVLASIPGFSMKPRRRSNKKISTAAQIEQTKDGKIDLETPDSVLVGTNLRALLNKHTFSLLPPLYQYNLVQLLPNVDCPEIDLNSMNLMDPEQAPSVRLNASSLNNEFFARACLEWRERLAEGEFTPENQVKLKTEAEKEKNKLDPWKLKHFEPIWGNKKLKNITTATTSSGSNNNNIKNNNICSIVIDKKQQSQQQQQQIKSHESLSSSSSSSLRPALKTTIKLNKSITSIPSTSSHQSTIYSTTASVVSTTVSPASTSYSNLPPQENLTTDLNLIKSQNEIVNSTGNLSPRKSSRNSGGAVTRAQQHQQQQINDDISINIDTNNQEDNYVNNDENILTEEIIKQPQIDIIQNVTTTTTTPIIKTGKLIKCDSGKEEVILENKLKLNESLNKISSPPQLSIDNIKGEFIKNEYKLNHNKLIENSLSTARTIDNKSIKCNLENGTILYEIEVNCFDNLKAINKTEQQNQIIQNNQFDNNSNNTTTIINKSRTLKRSSSSPEYICDNNSKQIKYSSINQKIDDIIDDEINNYSTITTATDDGLSSSGDSIVNLDNNLTTEAKIIDNNKSMILKHEARIVNLNENNLLSYDQQQNNQLTNNLNNNPSEESSSNDMLSEKTSCNSLELNVKLELNDDIYGQNNNVLINNNDNCINNSNINLMNEIINDNTTEDDKQTTTTTNDLLNHHEELISNDYQNSIEAGTSSGYSLYEQTTTTISTTAPTTIKTEEAASTTNSFNFQENPFNFHQNQQQNIQSGLQQIPSSSLTIQNQQQREQNDEDDLMDNFMGVGDLGSSSGAVGAMLTCSEETSSSTSGLVDCSGDNSADDNNIEELVESNIQQITIPTIIEDDPIEQKFADAENYLLETAGEISTDSGEASNLALIDGIKIENQENMFGTMVQGIPSTSNSVILNAVEEDQQQRQHIQHQHQQQKQQLLSNEEDNYRTQQQSGTTSFSSSLSSSSSSSMSLNSGGINTNTAINSSSNSNNNNNNQNMVQQQNILSTNDIYQHVKHDWNFGIKVESNQSAMMDSTSSTDVNGLGGGSGNTTTTNIILQQNQLQNFEDNLPQQLLRNEQEEQEEDEQEAEQFKQQEKYKQHQNDDDNEQQQHNVIEISEGAISGSISNNNINTDNRSNIINNQDGVIYQNHQQQHQNHHQLNHQNYSIDNGSISQISSDLEIPMTAAEMEVSSTVASNNSTNSNDSSLSNQSINDVIMQQQQQQQNTNNNNSKLLLTSQQQQQILRQQQNLFAFQANQNLQQQQQIILKNVTPTGVTQYTTPQQQQQSHHLQAHTLHQQQQQQIHLSIQPQQSNIHQMPLTHQQQHLQTQQQQINNNFNKIIKTTQQQQQPRTTSNPTGYISLSSNQPLKLIPNTGIPSTIATQRPKILPNNNNGNSNNNNNNGTQNSSNNNSGKGRRSSNKLPPGAVNLERSYQICQAVIQNSPNRHQLTAQLRPPPSMLASSTSAVSNTTTTMTTTLVGNNNIQQQQQQQQQKKIEEQIVTSTGGGTRTVYKVIGGPRLGFPRRKFVPRQASPTLIRHVYTTAGSGINGGVTNQTIQIQQHNHQQQQLIQGVIDQQTQSAGGRYVLVHRANVGAADNQAPRASSAPPAQNQQLHGVNGVPISGRGRPASVDVDTPNTLHEVQHVIGPNPGIQAVTRRTINQGLSYGDISIDQNHQTYVVTAASANSSGENTPPNCLCSLNPMIICQQCGAFMHDDCASIGPAKLCVSCVIR